MGFDPSTIDDRTTPTRDDALRMVETGALPVQPNRFPRRRLVLQWETLLPVAVETLPAFARARLEFTEREVVVGQRLAALLVPAAAEREALRAAWAVHDAAALRWLDLVRDGRDDVVRLARDRRLPDHLFRVNLGEGDPAHALPGAHALLELLDRHGARLAAPELVAEIRDGLRDATEELHRALVAQEQADAPPSLPAATDAKVRGALYALLVKLSRLGPLAVRATPALRGRCALALLKPRPGWPGGGDDDEAPVAETSPGGIGTPAEPVAATAARG